MAYDYTGDIAFANEMIDEFGRSVSVSRATSGAADPNDPLAGPGAPVPPVGIRAVQIYPSGTVNLGGTRELMELFPNSSKIFMAGYDGVNDLSEFVFLVDENNTSWKIDKIQVLQPGNEIILYYIGVSRP